MKKKKFVRVVILVLITALVGGSLWYVNDYYHALPKAEEYLQDHGKVKVIQEKDRVVFEPEEVKAGLVFYPGGKVEYTAYAPLMMECAQKGILCVLVRMPANLAVLNPNAAAGIPEEFPQTDYWLIGGHSLGGAMAASYAGKHSDEYDGLVLCAAYSTADLKQTGLKVLSIYGSEDGVLNLDKYEKYHGNLPDDVREIIIEGGCHAYFGMYGSQKGDGNPSVSNMYQIEATASRIADLRAQ